jgi:hypothetical protein
LLAGDARVRGGQPAAKRAQQRRVDRRHPTRNLIEGSPVELDHDRIARRDDRRGARNAGEEADLADRSPAPISLIARSWPSTQTSKRPEATT